jgi:hypothetical protein
MRVFPVLVSLALAAAAQAGERAKAKPKLKPGVWAPLVKADAKWTLDDTMLSSGTITVTTFDVRKVAGADVARLKWTYGKDKPEPLEGSEGRPTQVAVNKKGIWFLDASATDKDIEQALKKKKPDYADPPKVGRSKSKVVSATTDGDKYTVCVGYEPKTQAAACDGTCFGHLCISQDGFAMLDGTYSPNEAEFDAPGFKTKAE